LAIALAVKRLSFSSCRRSLAYATCAAYVDDVEAGDESRMNAIGEREDKEETQER